MRLGRKPSTDEAMAAAQRIGDLLDAEFGDAGVQMGFFVVVPATRDESDVIWSTTAKRLAHGVELMEHAARAAREDLDDHRRARRRRRG